MITANEAFERCAEKQAAADATVERWKRISDAVEKEDGIKLFTEEQPHLTKNHKIKRVRVSVVKTKCCGDVQAIGPSQDEMNCPCNKRPDIWNDCEHLGDAAFWVEFE